MNDAARKYIAKALGALWLLDGLLQFQPLMFGQAFVDNVLAPTLSNQPGFMTAIITWGTHLWSSNMIVTNSLAALLQVAIGVLLFFPLSSKTFKSGLWLSILWGIVVWLCGEGAGQLLTGGASFYTGAPGAVTLYMLVAALLLIGERISTVAYPKIAGWLCVFGACLQLQPSLWSADGAQGNFMMAMMDPLHALSVLPDTLYNAVALAPALSNVLLWLALLAVGLALSLKPNKVTGIIALAFLLFVWWFGQDLGQLSSLISGTATDPNTAPLIALLLVPLFVKPRQVSGHRAAASQGSGVIAV